MELVSCFSVHTPWKKNFWWLDLNFLSQGVSAKYCADMQLPDTFSLCCSNCCVAFPSSSQQHFLTLETSVASN